MLGNSPISSLATVPHVGEHLGSAFDRLSWVRVVVGGGATRYEVVGMARHRSRSCQVSAITAASLIGAGLPAVMSRTSGFSGTASFSGTARTSRPSRPSRPSRTGDGEP